MSKYYDWDDDDDPWSYEKQAKPSEHKGYTPPSEEQKKSWGWGWKSKQQNRSTYGSDFGTYPSERKTRWWETDKAAKSLSERKPDSLSGFWSDRWGGWKSDVDKDMLKVQAMDSVDRVGRIVFAGKHEFTWITNQKTKDIVLDTAPLEDSSITWSNDKRVDALMGGALAEAAQTTADRVWSQTSMEEGGSLEWASRLHDTYRWLRGVQSVSENFPGYSGYFSTNREFFHNEAQRRAVNQTVRNAITHEPRSRGAAVLATVWNALMPDGVDPLDVGSELNELTQRLGKELREVKKLHSKDAARVLTRIKDELEKLPDTVWGQKACASDKSQMGVGNEFDKSRGKKLLDEKTADRVIRAAKMEMREEKDLTDQCHFFKGNYGGGEISTWTQKALRNSRTDTAYNQAKSNVFNLIARTRASLSFRNEISRMNDLGLRSGLLDEAALANVVTGSDRLFRRQEVVSAPSVHVGVMVDQSGSMFGPGVQTAQQTAVLVYEATRNLPGISLSVWGHSANVDPARGGCLVDRYIERNQGDAEVLGAIHAGGNNLDGAALLYAARRMHQLSQPGESRILFALLDGQPAGQAVVGGVSYDYGYGSGLIHMRDVINSARKNNVQVYGLGMGAHINSNQMDIAFGSGNWQICTNVSMVPQAMAQLLKKALRTGRV